MSIPMYHAGQPAAEDAGSVRQGNTGATKISDCEMKQPTQVVLKEHRAQTGVALEAMAYQSKIHKTQVYRVGYLH